MNPTSAIPQVQPTTAPTAAPAPAADPSQFGDYSNWAQEEMAKGFTADQLHQSLADNKISVAPAAAAAPAAGGEPWWSKIMPAAGGILGGIGGGLLDVASLGALAPLINPITGAAVGGALGQAGENAVKGQNPFQANDITSGIENGAGQLIGGGVAKIVGGLGKGILGAGEKAAENATTQAADAAGQAAAATDQKATELNFGGIHPDMQKILKLGDSQDLVNSLGHDGTNPQDLLKVSEAGTALNNVYDRALQNAAPVDTADLNSKLFTTTPVDSPTLTPAEVAELKAKGINPDAIAGAQVTGGSPATTSTFDPSTPMGQALQEFSKKTGVDISNGLPANMPATQVRQLQQAVGRQIGTVQKTVNGAQLSGKYDADLMSKLQDLNESYGTLGSAIKTPEVDAAIKEATVTPADRQGLIAQYGDKLGSHIADTIDNAQSADHLLGPMQNFKRMNDAGDMALEDITQARATPRATARQQFAANGGIAPSSKTADTSGLVDTIHSAAQVVHSPTAAIIDLGRKIHASGVTPKVAQMMGNTLTRTAPLIPAATTGISNIPNIAAETPSSSAIPSVSGQGDPSMQPGAQQNPMNTLYAQLLAQERAAPTVLGPSLAGPLASMAPGVQQNDMTAQTMSALAPTYANAGGPQGAAGGFLSKLTAMLPGTAANTYQAQQEAAAAQLAKTLGISPQAAMAMLPGLMQNQGTAAPQMQATGGLVNQLTAGLPAQ